MVLRLLPILLITLIFTDIYLYFRFLHGKSNNVLTYLLFFLPNAALLISTPILIATENHTPANMGRMIVFFSLFLLIVMPKIMFIIGDIISKLLCLIVPKARKTCTLICYTLSVIIFMIMLSGITFGPSILKVRHLDFASPDVPASFDGYRIVQFSDLHLTSFQHHPQMVKQIVETILQQKPDLIAFTGDLITIDVNELDGYEDILSSLNAPDGVYSILGNHDYMTYASYLNKREQAIHRQELIRRQKEIGWDLLLNEHRIIKRGADNIVLLGVENFGKPPFPQRGDLKKAMSGLSKPESLNKKRQFKLLLSHDPTHWRMKVLPETDIQLTLSGHTHGMQFMIFGWSPSKYFYPEWKYLYTEGTHGLYVSLGLGGALLPFRFGAWPEINVITLRRK